MQILLWSLCWSSSTEYYISQSYFFCEFSARRTERVDSRDMPVVVVLCKTSLDGTNGGWVRFVRQQWRFLKITHYELISLTTWIITTQVVFAKVYSGIGKGTRTYRGWLVGWMDVWLVGWLDGGLASWLEEGYSARIWEIILKFDLNTTINLWEHWLVEFLHYSPTTVSVY